MYSTGKLTEFPLKDPRYTTECFPANFGLESTTDTRPVRFSGGGIFPDISILHVPQPGFGQSEGAL
jgi:hypothetical protein